MFIHHRRFRSRRLAKRRARALLLKVIGLFLACVAVLSTASFLFSREGIQIRTVRVEGGMTVVADELRAFVSEKIKGSYFFLFPKTSIVLYPRGAIEAGVRAAFPKVKEADVYFEDFQTITLAIEERIPFALWCGEEKPVVVEYATMEKEDEDSACYFLDETGFVFTKAPDFSGNAFFRYYGALHEHASGPEFIGARFLDPGEFRRVSFFLNTLESIDLSAVFFSVRSDRDVHDYELTLEDGTRFLISRSLDLDETARSIEAAFRSGELLSDTRMLDYADFRFRDKVYYAWK